jgi:hypothetical protein
MVPLWLTGNQWQLYSSLYFVSFTSCKSVVACQVITTLHQNPGIEMLAALVMTLSETVSLIQYVLERQIEFKGKDHEILVSFFYFIR